MFIVWIGVQPRFFLDRMAPTLDQLNAPVRNAVNETLAVRGSVNRDDEAIPFGSRLNGNQPPPFTSTDH